MEFTISLFVIREGGPSHRTQDADTLRNGRVGTGEVAGWSTLSTEGVNYEHRGGGFVSGAEFMSGGG